MKRNKYTFAGDVASLLLSQMNKAKDNELLDPIGLKDFWDVIEGFQKGDLILVGARPAMGKTAFALRIFRELSIYRAKTIAYFSPTIIKEELVGRLLVSSAGIKHHYLRTGKFSDDEYSRLCWNIDELKASNAVIDDTSDISIEEVFERSIQLKEKEKIDFIILDGLQDLRASGEFDSSQQEMEYNVKKLKELAQTLNIPIMLTSSISRSIEYRQDHHPELSDLLKIGNIEKYIDTVIFIHRDDYYIEGGWKYNGLAEITVPKHREGYLDYLYLEWCPEYYNYVEHKNYESAFWGLSEEECDIGLAYEKIKLPIK